MSDYHPFVPPMGKARYFGLTHSQVLDSLPPQRLQGWKARLDSLRAGPFRGITTEGQVAPGLFALRDEGAPTAGILAAVATLFSRLTPEQLKTVKHPIDSIERRQWVNEVPRYERYGIWLDEVTPAIRDAAMDVLRTSLSAAGYEKSLNVMKLNGFLGGLVGHLSRSASFATRCTSLASHRRPSPGDGNCTAIICVSPASSSAHR